jgi:hypothetical protein
MLVLLMVPRQTVVLLLVLGVLGVLGVLVPRVLYSACPRDCTLPARLHVGGFGELAAAVGTSRDGHVAAVDRIVDRAAHRQAASFGNEGGRREAC